MKNKTLIVIVGPTAVGKTQTAVTIAKQLNCEILSADSRQFYKELTIGTAKPSKEEMNGVPHHFIDNLSITEDYSAGQFEVDALRKLKELYTHQDVAILVGGSGLFINAVCFGLDDIPPVSPETREKWNQEWENKGRTYIQELVKKIDPAYYKNVDKENKHRLLRALETWDESGKQLSSIQKNEHSTRPFKTIFIGLNDERTIIYDRINMRVDKMIQEGLLNEVNLLIPFNHLNPLKTVGYQEFYEAKENGLSIESAIELVKRNSRRYAKRQITWFKKTPGIEWFTIKDLQKIEEYIKRELDK